MSVSRTSLLTIRARFTPGGTDEHGDFDPDWELIGVESEEKLARCEACGDPGQVEPAPPPSDPPDRLSPLEELLRPRVDAPRLCDACVAEEEIFQCGLEDLILESVPGLALPERETSVIFVGKLRFDCARDWETGYDDCDVEFKPVFAAEVCP